MFYTDSKGDTIKVLEKVQKIWMVIYSLDLVSKIKIFITKILYLWDDLCGEILRDDCHAPQTKPPKVKCLTRIWHPNITKTREICTVSDFILGGSKITAAGDCSHEIKRRFLLGRKVMTILDSILKSRDITDKGLSSQNYGFSSSHIWMWELYCKESWVP